MDALSLTRSEGVTGAWPMRFSGAAASALFWTGRLTGKPPLESAWATRVRGDGGSNPSLFTGSKAVSLPAISAGGCVVWRSVVVDEIR